MPTLQHPLRATGAATAPRPAGRRFRPPPPAALLLPLLAVVCLLPWLPYLDAPLQADAAGYATAAYWWARGDTLYRDLTITRPQGIFVLFRLFEAAGLGSPRGLHLAAAACALLSAGLVYALAARLGGARVGWTSAAVFAILIATPSFEGYSVNAELFMLPPTLACVLLLPQPGHERRPARAALWRLGGCGLLAALAMLIKPSGGAIVPCVALWLLWRRQRDHWSWRHWLHAEGWLGGGCLLGLLPALAHGWLIAPERYVSAVLLYRVGEDSLFSLSWRFQLAAFAEQTATIVTQLPILALAAYGLWAARHRLRRDGPMLLWLWFLTALGGAALGGHWYRHYYQQVLPPLALAAGCGLCQVFLSPRNPARCAGLLVALVLAFASLPGLAPNRAHFTPSELAAPAIARYLAAHTTADEAIYVGYEQPAVYYLAQRRPAARWLYLHELKRTPGAFADQAARLRDPVAAPCYLVMVQPFGDRPALRAVVAHDYTLATTIAGDPVFRRDTCSADKGPPR